MVRRRVATALVASLLLGGCWFGGDDDADEPPTTTSVTDSSTPGDGTDAEPVVNVEGAVTSAAPLGLRLSEGAPAAESTDAVDVVAGTPLGPDEVQAIFDRLAPWDVPPTDRTDFERPAETLPPPIPGVVVDGTFPPPVDAALPDASPDGPLQVLRFQPEGPVDVAPFVAVTFDQPMVPLATLDQLSAADVPLQISPPIEGRWRWIGTRTLRFEVEPGATDRLPAATEFRLVVPAGTTSQNGTALADDVVWTFRTPAPTVERFVGDAESTPLDPVFVAVFDQLVDPADVVETISLTAGSSSVAVRLASDAEIEADERARPVYDGALDGRAVAFTPAADLPPDAAFTVRIGPDTPSAEGPLTSTMSETFTGRTFGSLEVVDTRCDSGDGCTPGTPLGIEFSNVLDPELFDASLVDVEPAIPGLSIDVFGSFVALSGATTGRTTYTVTLGAGLTDVFGQTLGSDTSLDFRVGSARPALLGLQRSWITVDPAAETPQVSVSSINHDSIRVRAWAVTPAELSEFSAYRDRMWRDTEAADPDWSLVLDETVDTDGDDDQWVETAIDLGSAFEQTASQLVVRVDPTLEVSDDDVWRNQPTIAWVQSTTLAIDAFVDHDRLVIWTTDLLTGEPVGGVPIELIGDGRLATTGEEGLAEIELGDSGVVGLWANAGDRTSFLPAFSQGERGWQSEVRPDETRWYVFDDRGVYRPGETVRVTGWVRNLDAGAGLQLRRFDGEPSVEYRAWDAQGNELRSGSVALNALGGFNLSIDVPAGANLGAAWLELELTGVTERVQPTNHTFSIQEFRRPEFEVDVQPETPAPHVATEPATVRVDAGYFSGGPLGAAPVEWSVSKRSTTYQPPNWDDFTFGIWTPWWFADTGRGFDGADVAFEPCFDCGPGSPADVERFSGATDPGGRHYLQIDFDREGVDLPTSVTAEATVTDVNRQAIAGRTDLVVHAARHYVGLRSDRAFVRQGTPIRIDAVVTDIDGGTVPGRDVTVTAARVEWVRTAGEWVEQLVDEQTCAFTSTGDVTDDAMRCEFATDVGGTYRITAIVRDDEGGSNRTELTQWVSGGSAAPQRGVDRQTATIVPDRETYEPGDTAELLVQAPFAPAHGVVTVLRGGIVSTEAFDAEDGSAVIEIAIDESWVPGVEVQVDLAGAEPRVDDDGAPVPDAPDRPAFAAGRISLSIPPVTRALDVDITPAETELAPGTDTTVSVAVRDADDRPVAGADVAVIVVDEAVLSLTGYELADPLDAFYRTIWSRWEATYLRSSVVLARSDLLGADGDGLAARTAGDGAAAPTALEEASAADFDDAGGDDAAGGGSPIDVRTNFDALAVYAPDESTGADGTVTVEVPLPDSLTRYRVMAVAVDGDDRFGSGSSSITARLPLQVRPSAPRFLNFGDRFELPVVVQNQTGEPMEVDVAVELANLTSTGAVGKRVTVPADDRVEVRFPVTSAEVGTARFRVAAVGGGFADAAESSLPVYTPSTAEAFATYGVLDEGAIAQPILAPVGVIPQFGGLEVNTSSTALQALTDAVLYLNDYPYESSDGLASRIMAVAALRDVLTAFDADGLPPPDEIESAVRRDIAALVALQNDDGGFPSWQRGRSSVPWSSIQATHSLVLADAAGFTVPAAALDRALGHLAEIETSFPADYSDDMRDSLSAYALSVRADAGRRDVAKATDLYRRTAERLQPDAIAWLWSSIDDPDLRAEIETRFTNAAVETAGAATFATSYGEDAYVIAHSDRRTDGVVLGALLTEAPNSDLVPKVVAGLLAGQRQGRWRNAQENAFILLAMNRYFDTFESVTPDFVARAWLGDLYAAEATFDGRTTERAATLVPMQEVIGAGDAAVVLAKDGEGRLYYRLGLRYAPSDLVLDARDEGFVVERRYEAVGDESDVRREADGTWTIRAGAVVRVSLTMVADARRTHVALVDPLPAGLEPLDPAAATTPTVPPADDETATWPWWWSWFEHQNLRDDRAEAFATLLRGGTYEYTYLARATTPGEFVVPPTRAEEIYAPEVFGRSASDRVVVG